MNKGYVGTDLSTLVFHDSRNPSHVARRVNTLTKKEALDIGKRFAMLVRAKFDPEARIFVFGSVIKGTARLGSDIDVAVVSSIFDGDYFREAGRVSSLAQSVSWDIEVHAVTSRDWTEGDPHVLEIQKWGIAL